MLGKQNIFLIGPMGAGKTTIGRYLANELGRKFYDSDHYIEEMTGVNLRWIFDIEGEAGFREREKKAINELTQLNAIVLATGGGSILLQENRNCLAARGLVIYLKTTIDEQMTRTEKDKKRPLLQNVADKREILDTLAKEREQLYEEIADLTLNTDEGSVRGICDKILDLLRQESR
jgi:shikimate kinase